MVQIKLETDATTGKEVIRIEQDAGPSAGQLITQSNDLFKNMKAMARSLMPAGKAPYIYSALEKLAEAIDTQTRVTALLKTVEDYVIAYTRGSIAK